VLAAVTKRRVLPLLLGLIAFVLVGATLPHLHTGPQSGFWNHDHDLTLMATFGSQACQPDAMPVLGLVPALATAPMLATAQLAGAPLRRSAPRAPPLS